MLRLRFRITLRRYFDTPKNITKGSAELFFPCCNSSAAGDLIEVGENRILEVTLFKDDVVKLQKDYMQSSEVEAVKSFIVHQIGYSSSSWQGWTSIYGSFTVASVQQLPLV